MLKGVNQGIPTEYAGVLFRSRLEARWAAMFNALDWEWEYEPLDLNGYIPDFVLMFEFAPLLIEVKPALSLGELRDSTRKIENSGWTYEALLVGARLLGEGNTPDTIVAGLLSQRRDDDGHSWWWEQGDFIFCSECRRPSLYHPIGAWNCYRCGAGGKVYGESDHIASIVEWFWKRSGNETQWRSQ